MPLRSLLLTLLAIALWWGPINQVVRLAVLLRIEHALAQAADAGAREASLRGSNRESVTQAVRRSLRGDSCADDVDLVEISINEHAELVHPLVDAQPGDKIAVTVGAWT